MTEKKKSIWSKIGKIALRTFVALLLLVMLLPFSLYIPWVQNIVKDYACEWASEETGLDISIDRILIKFPLDVSIDNLLVLDQQRDTMLRAGNFVAGVEVLPLFSLDVKVDEALLTDAMYRTVSEDSSMMMRAQVQECLVKGIDMDLDRNALNVVEGNLKGGRINMTMYPYKAVTECDTTQSKPWKIRAYHLNLEDIDYTMAMLPSIDSLNTHITRASLTDGVIDTDQRKINARSLAIDSTNVHYVYPSAKFADEYSAMHPVPQDTLCNPADTIPWAINADTLKLTGSNITYAQKDAVHRPGKGLDAEYIKLDGVDVEVVNFYNRGTDISLSLAQLALKECGSGLDVMNGSGDVRLGNDKLAFDNLHVGTLLSGINLDGRVDLSLADNLKKGQLQLTTDSKIAIQDITKLMPEYGPMLKNIPQISPVSIKGSVKGNMVKVNVKNLTVDMPRYAHATVSGTVSNPTDFNKMVGDLQIDGRFDNINFVKPTLLDKAMQKDYNFPPMDLKAGIKLNCGTIDADAVMTVAGGKMVGKGSFNANNEAFALDATFNNFPLKAIAPMLSTDDLSGHVNVRGKGFDFLSPNADIVADIDLDGLNYNNALYRNLRTNLTMSGGRVSGQVMSDNENCRVNMDINGTISGNHYDIDVVGHVASLDLHELNLYDGECRGHGRIVGYCDIDLDKKEYDLSVNVEDFEWMLDGEMLKADVAAVTFRSDAESTRATFDNEDNHLRFDSPHGLDALTTAFGQSGDIATDQFNRKAINIDTLQAALPSFKLGMQMGTDGLVQRYVQRYGVDFREVALDVSNDSTIFVDGHVHSLSLDGTNIDTLTLKATQWNKYLAFKAHMGNRPGTMDEFAQVTLQGGIRGATVDFLATQHNIHNEMGYRLGCNATLTDTAVNMRMFPKEPVIGYRKWVMNEDNFVNVNYDTNMLDANLRLESDSSVVALKTQRLPGAKYEDIDLNIANLRIEEWTKFLPNLDPMSGVLNADMKVGFDGHSLQGKGSLNLNDFVYNGIREGNLDINADYGVDPETGGTRVNADMLIDGSHVGLAYGSFGDNDDDDNDPVNMTLKLNRFPLNKASAFIPGRMMWMRGYLNGELQLAGNTANPHLNGYLKGDSAYVTMPKYGCSLKLCEDRLSIDDNTIKFNNYRIIGMNDNAVAINGLVDMRDMDDMKIDLSINGKNVQLIGSEQRTFSEVFGKAFADISATVTSRSNYMSIKADLDLLPTTNVTYVMQDEISSLANSVDENMVTFVNLNDSVGGMPNLVTSAATTATNILANINIHDGARLNAYLTPDGKDRANINGSGRLKYSLDFAGKDVLTGTYTIESGNFRYSPPLISQKNFTVATGSKVVWTGDMLNPQLSIKANEHVKTSVTSEDQGSRPADFNITANVGGTLSQIKLDFDLTADGDMNLQNELQSMSDAQRSQAAINLLLYNTYSGTNSAGAVNNLTASAALFSFVQSQLNSWAAKAIKGVDLSFGINQYEGKKGNGVETSYSYRLSKNLFNDRFKIVVGGEYSTDASAEENFAQNLISDISFEYSLNETGNKYVRLFRHTGFESMLEGQVTETGVGFVIKRKVASLFGRKPLKLNLVPVRKDEDENVEATDSVKITQ